MTVKRKVEPSDCAPKPKRGRTDKNPKVSYVKEDTLYTRDVLKILNQVGESKVVMKINIMQTQDWPTYSSLCIHQDWKLHLLYNDI